MDLKTDIEPEDGCAASVRSHLERASSYESENFYSNRIAILGRLMARTTNRMLNERFGLSPAEWRILIQLAYRSPSKISEMYERTLIKKPEISGALRLLAQRGYAYRSNDTDDARSPNFWITPEGLKLYRSAMRVTRRRQRGLESLLTKSQREVFSSVLDRLITFYFEEERRGSDAMFSESSRKSKPRKRKNQPAF